MPAPITILAGATWATYSVADLEAHMIAPPPTAKPAGDLTNDDARCPPDGGSAPNPVAPNSPKPPTAPHTNPPRHDARHPTNAVTTNTGVDSPHAYAAPAASANAPTSSAAHAAATANDPAKRSTTS